MMKREKYVLNIVIACVLEQTKMISVSFILEWRQYMMPDSNVKLAFIPVQCTD